MVENRLGQVTALYRAYRLCDRLFRLAPAVREYMDRLTVTRITAGTDIGPEFKGPLAVHDQAHWDAVAERPAWDSTVSMSVRDSLRVLPGEPTHD